MPNIHDNYFAHMFGHKEVLESFLKANLSTELLSKLDFTTLSKRDKSFLPSKYRNARHADLLYGVKKKDGKEVCFLIHLEHQSKHDKQMAVRILEYHAAIAKGYLEQEDMCVPPIITFVFYHGKEEWTSAQSISGLFSDFEVYLNEGLKKTFLVDLPKLSIKKAKEHGLSAAAELILAQRAKDSMKDILGDVLPILAKHSLCCKEQSLNYIFQNSPESEEEIIAEMRKFDKETAENYANMFERAIKRKERETRRETKHEIITRLAKLGFGRKEELEKALKSKK